MASTILASLVGVAVAGSFLSNAYWGMVWVPLALGVALIREDGMERRQRLQARNIAMGTTAANRDSGTFGRAPRVVTVRR